MADAKISALTALTAPASGDLAAVVDVSDTTHAPTGTTKKITLADLVTILASYGIVVTDAATTTITTLLNLDHESSGTPAVGFGGAININLKSATVASRNAAMIFAKWATATDATRSAVLQLLAADAMGYAPGLSIGTNGSGSARIAFLGAINTPVDAQTGDIGSALTTFGLMTGSPTLLWSRLASLVGLQYANLLRNGGCEVFQRTATPSTGISTGDGAYGMDGWYSLVQTAAVTQSQQAGTLGARYALRINQDQASAQRMGVAQIIESSDSIPYRGRSVYFQFQAKVSTGTPNVRFAVLEWTGTADSVTKDVVNSWTSGTYTGGNFFVSSNLTVGVVSSGALSTSFQQFTIQYNPVSASCNNLIVFIWTEATAAQNVQLTVTELSLHDGIGIHNWIPEPVETALRRCQRYGLSYYSHRVDIAQGVTAGYGRCTVCFPVTMRAVPNLGTSPSPAFAVNAGSAGTMQLENSKVSGTGFSNSAANWTVSAVIDITCFLDAELGV